MEKLFSFYHEQIARIIRNGVNDLFFNHKISKSNHRNKKSLEMRGIEPRAFHMQSERSTTELHPRRFQPTFADPNC